MSNHLITTPDSIGGKVATQLTNLMNGTSYKLKKLVFIKSLPNGPDQVLHTDSEGDSISILCGLNCDLRLNVNLLASALDTNIIDLHATFQVWISTFFQNTSVCSRWLW